MMFPQSRKASRRKVLVSLVGGSEGWETWYCEPEQLKTDRKPPGFTTCSNNVGATYVFFLSIKVSFWVHCEHALLTKHAVFLCKAYNSRRVRNL